MKGGKEDGRSLPENEGAPPHRRSSAVDPKYEIVALRQVDAETLGITWKDGCERRYAVRRLRLDCPCAKCVDEISGEVVLDETQVPEDVRPVRFEPVGRYALRIRWTDGHDTGLYDFQMLRDMAASP